MAYTNFTNTYLALLPYEIQDYINKIIIDEKFKKISNELKQNITYNEDDPETLYMSLLHGIIGNNIHDIKNLFKMWSYHINNNSDKKMNPKYIIIRHLLMRWELFYNNDTIKCLYYNIKKLSKIFDTLSYQELLSFNNFIINNN